MRGGVQPLPEGAGAKKAGAANRSLNAGSRVSAPAPKRTAAPKAASVPKPTQSKQPSVNQAEIDNLTVEVRHTIILSTYYSIVF